LLNLKRVNTKNDLVVTRDAYRGEKKWAQSFKKTQKKNIGQADA